MLMNNKLFNNKYRINILISLIIIIGFASIICINYITYSKVIKDDIMNITKLTSTNVYSEINNELTKPIFVSLTMANDSFLKDWLKNETDNLNNEAHLKQLQNYLLGMEMKYGYNSVFLISEQTNRYYHYKGIHKVISPEDEHDKWYYSFINKKKLYELDIDNDEAANNTLTVFVNCRVEEDNELIGVTGVGLAMNQIQTILQRFEDTYDLEAFLIDGNGLVQVHTNDAYIEKHNIFDEKGIQKYKNEIINNKLSLEALRFKQDNLNGYLITRYIDELDWYLVVKKDTSVLRKAFLDQLAEEMMVILAVTGIVVLLINGLIKQHKNQMLSITHTDQLTQLTNRRGFDEALTTLLHEYKDDQNPACVFVFDIDDFKRINDTKGHIFGDRVICLIGKYAKEYTKNKGMISRWGGDEFSGILTKSIDESKIIAQNIINTINHDPELNEHEVTISLGLTQVKKLDTVHSLLTRADQALYEAKNNGKNQMIIQ